MEDIFQRTFDIYESRKSPHFILNLKHGEHFAYPAFSVNLQKLPLTVGSSDSTRDQTFGTDPRSLQK